MQTIYSLAAVELEDEEKSKKAGRILDEKLNQVLDIYATAILYPVRIAEFSETDSLKRNSKYLRTEEDKHVNTKIAQNLFVKKMIENTSLNQRIKTFHLNKYINEDLIKKLYNQLTKTNIYQEYLLKEEHQVLEDKELIRHIWEEEMLKNEDLLSYFLDELPGWEDDKDLIILLMQNVFKGNIRIDFMDLLSQEKKQYAHELIATVIEKDTYCLSLITPKLNNWDTERVAIIDLILLKMGVCEFLYFPTIPTKVTINEYIDIAKQYSTPQSGHFVNGVLDNILKDLINENKVKKVERTNK